MDRTLLTMAKSAGSENSASRPLSLSRACAMGGMVIFMHPLGLFCMESRCFITVSISCLLLAALA